VPTFHHRTAAASLAALLLLAPLSALADTQFVLNGDVVTPPASVGPLTVTGSVSSGGSVFGAIEKGRFRAACSCFNPAVLGLFTPQVDAPMAMAVTANDVHVIAADPNFDPTGMTLTMHMLLTGDLASAGPVPFEGKVNVRAYNSNTDINSTLSTVSGSTGSGQFANATLHMVDYPLDFPLLWLVSPSNSQFMVIMFSTRAYGTSISTDDNSASADFSGAGLRFPTGTPAFDTPPGIAVSIPSLNIVNNFWVDPALGVAPRITTGGLALAALANPARGTARLALTLPADGAARVEVFDVGGRRVASLLDGWQAAGRHELAWDAGVAGAGVYLVRAQSGRETVTTRVAIVN
jgi:hypothetical protein